MAGPVLTRPRTVPDKANDALWQVWWETTVPRTGTVAPDAVLKRTFSAVGPQVEPVGRVEPFLITTRYGEIVFSVTATLCCLRASSASPWM